MRGLVAPNITDIEKYAVNYPGALEIIYQPLWDFTTYPMAGATSLKFFQNQVGNGGKTFEDTNMEGNGVLPEPQIFMCTGIAVEFYPAAAPSRSGAGSVLNTNTNDVYEVLKTGRLSFKVGNKFPLEQGPLGIFPPCYRMAGMAALTGEAAATTMNVVDYAVFAGKEFGIVPVTIPTGQNFNVTLEWETAVGVTADARIGVRLYGFLYRSVQ